MIIDQIIERLKDSQNRISMALPDKLRPFTRNFNTTDRAILLTGARGAGKTTLLMNLTKNRHILYVPADAPFISGISLMDIAETAFMKGYEGIIFDEVHFAKEWAVNLKAVYDSFPDKTIWASDSSSILLKKSIADLSRRFVIKKIPLLSFREYLDLRSLGSFEPISPFSADKRYVEKIVKSVNVLRYFQEYLSHGFRPIFMENVESYADKAKNVVEKIMLHDIPFIVPQLSENHFLLMRAVIGYLAVSAIPTLSVNSLCSEWMLSKEKLYQMLAAMEECGLIRIIRKKNDRKIHSIGAKIFFAEPTLYKVYEGLIGNVREAFTACAFSEAGEKIFAADSEKTGDFLVGNKLIEIGGLNKSRKNADYVIRDNLDIPDENRIPLWTLGMMY